MNTENVKQKIDSLLKELKEITGVSDKELDELKEILGLSDISEAS